MSTPALLAVSGSTLALALLVTGASHAHEAAIRAAGAADAAALAAADAATGWIDAEPCALAAQVSHSAQAQLDDCQVNLANGQVRISVNVQTVFGSVRAHARAAPFMP